MGNKLKQLWQAAAERPRVQDIFFVVLLLAIAVATHWQWFNPHSILTFGDWQYRPTESIRQMFSSWQTWVPFEGFGSVNILMSGFPFRGLAWSLIGNAGFSYDTATKLTLFIPTAIGGFLTAYLLAVRLFKDRFVSFIAALFYGTTPYYLSIQAGHLPINIIYLLTPLLVWLLDKALDKNRMHYWVSLALVFSVGVYYEVRIMYIVSIILLIYGAGYIWMHQKRLKPYIRPLLVCGGLIVLMNIFWLLPTKLAAGGSISEVAGRGLFGDSLFNLAQSFTVMKWNWTGAEVNRAFIAQPVPPYLWVVPLVALSAALFAKKRRAAVLIFLVITAIGLLLTKQSSAPFSGLYGWLYNNFPGFVLFREASKFYLLPAFGYFGLIGYALLGMREHEQYRQARLRPLLYAAAVAALLTISAINVWPAVNGSLAGTFRNQSMPASYVTFKDFIKKQPDFFRVYWLPRESWWGYYDNQHPRVRAIDTVEQAWQPFVGEKGGDGYEIARKNTALLQQPFADALFSNASIKYVVVPVRDIASDDDFYPSYGNDRQFYIDQLDHVPFLKRIDIGTPDLAVYENQNYKPYINAATSVYGTTESDNPKEQANFITGMAAAFSTDTLSGDRKQQLHVGSVDTLFDVADYDHLYKNGSLQQQTTILPGSYLQLGQKAQQLSYTAANGAVTLFQNPTGVLRYNGAVVDSGDSRKQLDVAPLAANTAVFLSVGDTMTPLDTSAGEHPIGSTTEPVAVYKVAGANAIANPSFESGAWGALHDCNNYDANPLISMDVYGGDVTDGSKALALFAQRHTGCMEQRNVPVTGGSTYGLRLDYRNEFGQQIGYKVTFNDPAHTVVQQQVPVTGQAWHTLWHRISVPAKATSATVSIMGYPGVDQTVGAITYYDNVRLEPLATIMAQAAPAPRAQKLTLQTGTGAFTYTAPNLDDKNAIRDPSFESGTWQKKVEDCHNYDSNAAISMGLDRTAVDGTQSLRLSATRHIACTHQSDVPVQSNTPYFFGFAYDANNTQQVRYRLVFNDPSKTVVDKYITVAKNNTWQSYTTALQTPLGATTVSISVYATPNAYGKKNVTIRYDNFQLIQTAAITGMYHVVSNPVGAPMEVPKSVTFFSDSPTKKSVTVDTATTPFFLMMNETYDAHWRLSGVPGTQHFKVNGPLNAWYVDPAAVCKAAPDNCTANSDGSYSLHLSVVFTAQRWFSNGLVVSGLTFVGCIVYIASAWYVHRPWKGKRRW